MDSKETVIEATDQESGETLVADNAPAYPYAAITSYLKNSIYPPDYTKEEKRGLRKRSKCFSLIGGKLHYISKKCSQPRLVIEDEEEQLRLIASIHNQAHFGRDKTLSQLSTRFYWPNIVKAVSSFVS